MRKLILISFLLFLSQTMFPQGYVVDQVIAVVGGEMVKQSELEELYLQARAENITMPEQEMRCNLLERILIQKLLLAQAKVDSVEIDQTQVDMQMNQRLNFFINQIGSQEKLEEYFNKSIQEIREDLRRVLSEEMTAGKVRTSVVGKVNPTPTEVRQWYRKIPKDSLPLIPAKIEVAEIGIYPPFAEEAVSEVKDKLLELRRRIIDGERFASLALFYSEDPGSASRGGELGFINKGQLDPAFGKAAWALKPNEVSRMVESQSGFHIIQMIEKRGDLANLRHILLKPKPDPEITRKAIQFLDSISNLIRQESLTFETAVRMYSQEKTTRFNKGLMINLRESSMDYGGTWFEMNEFSPVELNILRNLKPGEISSPYETIDDKGRIIYKIIRIVNSLEPHVADLEKDYNLLQNLYKREKESETLQRWIKEKAQTHYVRVDEQYLQCSFLREGWIK